MPDILATMGGIVRPSGLDRRPKPDSERFGSFYSIFNEHMYCCQMSVEECLKPADHTLLVGEPGSD